MFINVYSILNDLDIKENIYEIDLLHLTKDIPFAMFLVSAINEIEAIGKIMDYIKINLPKCILPKNDFLGDSTLYKHICGGKDFNYLFIKWENMTIKNIYKKRKS